VLQQVPLQLQQAQQVKMETLALPPEITVEQALQQHWL
jgi:hypothetical protein